MNLEDCRNVSQEESLKEFWEKSMKECQRKSREAPLKESMEKAWEQLLLRFIQEFSENTGKPMKKLRDTDKNL